MMFKKVMGFAMVLALTACGSGGKSKGEKKEKTEFEQVAAERTNVAASGYKTAKLTLKHYQKVEGQSMNENLYANFTLTDNVWVIGENNFPSAMTTYANMINFFMVQSQMFITLLQSKMATLNTAYYVAAETAELDIDGDVNMEGSMVGHIAAEVTWDKFGLFSSFHEKDDFSNYRGYNNVVIEETISVAYSK